MRISYLKNQLNSKEIKITIIKKITITIIIMSIKWKIEKIKSINKSYELKIELIKSWVHKNYQWQRLNFIKFEKY